MASITRWRAPLLGPNAITSRGQYSRLGERLRPATEQTLGGLEQLPVGNSAACVEMALRVQAAQFRQHRCPRPRPAGRPVNTRGPRSPGSSCRRSCRRVLKAAIWPTWLAEHFAYAVSGFPAARLSRPATPGKTHRSPRCQTGRLQRFVPAAKQAIRGRCDAAEPTCAAAGRCLFEASQSIDHPLFGPPSAFLNPGRFESRVLAPEASEHGRSQPLPFAPQTAECGVRRHASPQLVEHSLPGPLPRRRMWNSRGLPLPSWFRSSGRRPNTNVCPRSRRDGSGLPADARPAGT